MMPEDGWIGADGRTDGRVGTTGGSRPYTGRAAEPGRRGLNGGQRNRYFAPIRPGDEITSVVRLVDAYEKQGRLGPMMFLVDEARWTNQRGELVRIGQRTTIYH